MDEFFQVVSNSLIWWIFISIGLVVVFGLLVRAAFHKSDQEMKKNYLEIVLYVGGTSFLLAILSQILGFISALNAISEAGDISYSLVIDALKVSFYLPVYGLLVLIVSLLGSVLIRSILHNTH